MNNINNEIIDRNDLINGYAFLIKEKAIKLQTFTNFIEPAARKLKPCSNSSSSENQESNNCYNNRDKETIVYFIDKLKLLIEAQKKLNKESILENFFSFLRGDISKAQRIVDSFIEKELLGKNENNEKIQKEINILKATAIWQKEKMGTSSTTYISPNDPSFKNQNKNIIKRMNDSFHLQKNGDLCIVKEWNDTNNQQPKKIINYKTSGKENRYTTPPNITVEGGSKRFFKGTLNQSPVAILTPITKDNENVKSIIERMEKESNVLKELEDKGISGIPKIKDDFKIKVGNINLFYMVEELYKMNLFQLKNNQNSLSISQVKKMIEKLIFTIYEIHKQNFVHSDVKPENIFLNKINSDIDFILSDFDLSMTEEESLKMDDIRGTLPYIPPECLTKKNASKITKKSDVWSLGACFFEIMNIIKTSECYSLAALLESKNENFTTGNKYCLNFEHYFILEEFIECLNNISIDAKSPFADWAQANDIKSPQNKPIWDIIAKMLDPDPTTRWSAKQLYDEIQNLKRDQLF